MWSAIITEMYPHENEIVKEKWRMSYESLERLCRELSYVVDDDRVKEIHISKD
jgi:hypothetical protein